jgi:hypothetical protein
MLLIIHSKLIETVVYNFMEQSWTTGDLARTSYNDAHTYDYLMQQNFIEQMYQPFQLSMVQLILLELVNIGHMKLVLMK